VESWGGEEDRGKDNEGSYFDSQVQKGVITVGGEMRGVTVKTLVHEKGHCKAGGGEKAREKRPVRNWSKNFFKRSGGEYKAKLGGYRKVSMQKGGGAFSWEGD